MYKSQFQIIDPIMTGFVVLGNMHIGYLQKY